MYTIDFSYCFVSDYWLGGNGVTGVFERMDMANAELLWISFAFPNSIQHFKNALQEDGTFDFTHSRIPKNSNDRKHNSRLVTLTRKNKTNHQYFE